MENKKVRINEFIFDEAWIRLTNYTQGTNYKESDYRERDIYKPGFIKDPGDFERICKEQINPKVRESTLNYFRYFLWDRKYLIRDLMESLQIPSFLEEANIEILIGEMGKFFDLMDNRMYQGLFRYGLTKNQPHSKMDKLSNAFKRCQLYVNLRNRECLIDAANLFRIEYNYPGLKTMQARNFSLNLSNIDKLELDKNPNMGLYNLTYAIEFLKRAKFTDNKELILTGIIHLFIEFILPQLPNTHYESVDDGEHTYIPR